MATPITATVVSKQLSTDGKLRYAALFINEVSSMETEMAMYERYATKRTLPSHVYGDADATGYTGGDAMRATNVYTSKLDGFAITGYDSQSFYMNYGFRIDDMGNGSSPFTPTDSYGVALDYNQADFQINEGKGYGNTGTGATNYRIHDKALVSKFEVNCPLIRFGATLQKDSLADLLNATEDGKMIMKNFGEQANMVEAQYVRATLINEATQWGSLDYSTGGAALAADGANSLASLKAKLKAIRQQLNLRKGKTFAGAVNASDKIGTTAVPGGYVGIAHSLMEDFFEQDSEWIPVIDYANQTGLLPGEMGTFKNTKVRIVANDLLIRNTAAQITAGAAPAAGGMFGVADVMEDTELGAYNMLVMAKDAYTIATLKGAERHTVYVDGPGKGQDTLRIEANMGWKTLLGCKVHRKAYIHNINVIITD